MHYKADSPAAAPIKPVIKGPSFASLSHRACGRTHAKQVRCLRHYQTNKQTAAHSQKNKKRPLRVAERFSFTTQSVVTAEWEPPSRKHHFLPLPLPLRVTSVTSIHGSNASLTPPSEAAVPLQREEKKRRNTAEQVACADGSLTEPGEPKRTTFGE